MEHSKPIIGLCGGVGSGKSQVATEFALLGCLVIDSDRLNHEVQRHSEVLAEIRRWWGDGVIGADGGPNRQAIARLIFADAEQKQRLESLVHPLIRGLRENMIEAGNRDPAVKAIILDSPLLFESNLDRLCDTIVFVDADETRRLQRLQRERNWSPDELERRQQWQQPLAYKRDRSEFVIDNEGPVENLRPQVIEIFGRIVAGRSPAQ